MQVNSIDLSWIVVSDLKQAIKFYTEVMGLKLMELNEQYGWAEFQGHQGGSRLGVAQASEQCQMKAGQNAWVTFTVENIEDAKQALEMKGARCVGDIQEVPKHVKLLQVVDQDGNCFQIVQKLFASHD